MRLSAGSDILQVLSPAHDTLAYAALAEQARELNVYALPSYLRSLQDAEGYPLFTLCHRSSGHFAAISYVKRRINDLPGFETLDQEWFDLVSPYEYCAPITNCPRHSAQRQALFVGLRAQISAYCRDNRIVSEFVRFDPFGADDLKRRGGITLRSPCENVYIELNNPLADLEAGYHRSVRKNLRRATESGLTFTRESPSIEAIDTFNDLYRRSMDRLQAKPYYYFSREYFGRLLSECSGAYLFAVRTPAGRAIASSIVLMHEGVAHHHLTGCDPDFTEMRPNDFKLHNLIAWAKSMDARILHLGGGSSSIREFKGKFSQCRARYQVGCVVHNQETYDELANLRCEQSAVPLNPDFFPLYRA